MAATPEAGAGQNKSLNALGQSRGQSVYRNADGTPLTRLDVKDNSMRILVNLTIYNFRLIHHAKKYSSSECVYVSEVA